MADEPAKSDTPQDRLAKLLPGDVTAAFLSAQSALLAVSLQNASTYVFWTFVAIVLLCPAYFWFVTRVKSPFHIVFLTLSFAVFGFSIASTAFVDYFRDSIPEGAIRAFAIVLPILWTYLVTQISVAALKYEDKSSQTKKVDEVVVAPIGAKEGAE